MKKLLIGILAVVVIGTTAVLALNFMGTDTADTADEKSGVYIELADGTSDYPVDIGAISYKIVNETGQSVNVVLIPKLERNLGLQFEEKWEQVDFTGEVGFCGTPDTIESKNTHDGTIETNWYKNIVVGKYRLTFEGHNGTVVEPVEFVLHKEKTDLQMRKYEFEGSTEQIVKPYIALNEGNKFQFFYSPLSSYFPNGTYEVDDNHLILIPDDELHNKYVFEIVKETLVFDAEKSSEIPSFADVPNGSVFK